MRGVVILDQDCLTRRNEYSVATFSFIFRLKERFFTIQQFHKKMCSNSNKDFERNYPIAADFFEHFLHQFLFPIEAQNIHSAISWKIVER